MVRSGPGGMQSGRDAVIVEEPMEIRVGSVGDPDEELDGPRGHDAYAGHDFELATGFLITEGIVADQTPSGRWPTAVCRRRSRSTTSSRCGCSARSMSSGTARNVYTTSSCGVCGKASIDAVEVACPHRPVAAADRPVRRRR